MKTTLTIWKPADLERDQVRQLAGAGVAVWQIAQLLGETEEALREACATELAAGRASLVATNCLVLEALRDLALSGKSLPAALFWVKTRCCGEDAAKAPAAPPPTAPLPFAEPPTLVVVSNSGEPVDVQ